MCGIFGIVNPSTITLAQIRFLEDAFTAGAVRGPHGSGLFTVSTSKKVRHAARAVSGSEFVNDKIPDELSSTLVNAVLAVGHNRFATSGSQKDDNCHPFAFSDVIGVHNGGIPPYVLKLIDPDDSHVVDSGRIYAALSKAENPLDVLTKIYQGAYALVWHDARESCLYMARNESRPIFIAEGETSLYFASELGMMSWLLSRNDLAEDDMQMCSLDINTLYKFPLDSMKDVTKTPYAAVAPVIKSTYKHAIRGVKSYGGNRGYVVRSQLFYHEEELLKKFPCLKRRVKFVHDQIIDPDHGAFSPIIPVIMYGITDPYTGIKNIYGAVSTKDGKTQCPDVLCCSRGTASVIEPYTEHLPTLDTEDEDCAYPIIFQYLDSYKIRPTGELIILGRPVLNMESDTWITGIPLSHMDWAQYACSTEYLDQQDTAQIEIMWMDLAAGNIITDDDLPF